MKNPCVRPLALALLLLPGSLSAAQQEQQPPASPTSVRYEIRYMDLHAAEVLAWDQCTQKARCRVASLSVGGDSTRGYLEVLAEPATHEKLSRALAKEDGSPRTLSFQVLLLSAGTQAGNGGTEVPANAQKALADLKGFLPFKSYELLDTAWLRTTQDRAAGGRLVGRYGASYDVTLAFRNVGSREDRGLHVQQFRLKAEPFTPPEASKEKPRGGRIMIDTSFGLKEGETIVVGTSKVDGADDALVVLLTAVPVS